MQDSDEVDPADGAHCRPVPTTVSVGRLHPVAPAVTSSCQMYRVSLMNSLSAIQIKCTGCNTKCLGVLMLSNAVLLK